MRILEKGSFLLGLEELGMAKQDYQAMDRLLRTSHGILLVTGPTGSGKSTTLYAALQRVLSPDINVITVEDPVEYQMKGVGQIEVRPKIGLTFASALRSILRQDPDVILVGEIRDLETAEMAVHASLTGHLVFSTLHTNDSAGAITRLVNMGIEPFLVTSSTIAILAQRLVRRLCQECRKTAKADAEMLRELGPKSVEVLGRDVYQAVGCSKCQERGYYGRTGIFELLPMTPHVQELTLGGADSNIIKREARKAGTRSLRDDGTRKVLDGVTTIEEVLRVTRDEFLEEVIG
jgi:general secretion pathway protein E